VPGEIECQCPCTRSLSMISMIDCSSDVDPETVLRMREEAKKASVHWLLMQHLESFCET
jgi:hypothetical protein